MHAAVRESKESRELPYRAFSPLLVTVALLFMHTMCYLGSSVSGDWSKAAVNFGTSLYQFRRWHLIMNRRETGDLTLSRRNRDTYRFHLFRRIPASHRDLSGYVTLQSLPKCSHLHL